MEDIKNNIEVQIKQLEFFLKDIKLFVSIKNDLSNMFDVLLASQRMLN